MRIHTDILHPPISRGLLGALCLAMALGMLAVGLWPFTYLPRNRVSWLTGANGIRFEGRGQALASRDIPWPSADFTGVGLTLELFLRPARSYRYGIPHILTLCDSENREVLYLGQWKEGLIIRLLSPRAGTERVVSEIGASAVLSPGETTFITLVSDMHGTSVFSNGVSVDEFGGLDLASVLAQDPVHAMVLGNSSYGDSPWQGEVLGMAILDRALTQEEVKTRFNLWIQSRISLGGAKRDERMLYLFDQGKGELARNLTGNGWDLEIPEKLTPLTREWLTLPNQKFIRHKRSFLSDVVINLFGFVPLGAALCLFFTAGPGGKTAGVSFWLPVAIGAALSLFIELNQAFLVSRNSSLLDLVLNTLGSAAGAALAVSYLSKKQTGPNGPVTP